MMTPNESILAFLDGMLSEEDEAELLHRLSVSPERRTLLRSYLNQKQVLAADRLAIHVPYDAEQELWSRIAQVDTPEPFITAEPNVPAMHALQTSSSLWSRIAQPVVASVSGLALILGLSSGYYLGRSEHHNVYVVNERSQPSVENNASRRDAPTARLASKATQSEISGSALNL